MTAFALRGRIAHCLRDPGPDNDPGAIEAFEDGLLVIEDGRVAQLGPADDLLKTLPENFPVTHYDAHLIVPGFVDCHVHYPQVDVLASYGKQLLDWLNDYTFPSEARFADRAVADEAARFFVDELLANGTTTALVFCTVHAHSVDALFEAAARYNLRVGAGKVLMDRHCPENLCDTAESGYRESRELIERWHGNGRAHYAITPRFAPTSSNEQLRLAGELANEFPDTLVHTHLAENPDEIAWVGELFPEADDYLDVYARAGLLRDRSVFAHCLHLSDQEFTTMGRAGGAALFCPTSNLFLGSGLFDLARAKTHGVRVGLGTDIGGGTSFSLLRTAGEAYKVLQLQGQSLTGFRALYLATLGGAEALHLDDKIGSFRVGMEADIAVIKMGGTPVAARRHAIATSIEESLFVSLIVDGAQRIRATYAMGREVMTHDP
ncbi:MAG: guanine deaminase [Pseudomonadota bacterium]